MRDHRKLGAFESADAHPEMSIPAFEITVLSCQLSALSYQLSAFSYQLAYSLTNLHSSTLMKTSQAGIG